MTQEFTFKNPNDTPTFDQSQLYGRKVVGKELTRQEASDLIGKLTVQLGEESETFELKNPTDKATFKQFGLIGTLYGKINGFTTMKAISEQITKLS